MVWKGVRPKKDILIKNHIDQSEHNKKLLNELQTNYLEYKDWILTTLFYYSLHRVQAKIVRDTSYYPENHFDDKIYENSRNQIVANLLLDNQSSAYLALYQQCRLARYRPLSFKYFKEEYVLTLVKNITAIFDKIL